jgi:hypothetical protein
MGKRVIENGGTAAAKVFVLEKMTSFGREYFGVHGMFKAETRYACCGGEEFGNIGGSKE